MAALIAGPFSLFQAWILRNLERIQLPVPTASRRTTYNHLLAERLIRIMNNAAQPGARMWVVP